MFFMAWTRVQKRNIIIQPPKSSCLEVVLSGHTGTFIILKDLQSADYFKFLEKRLLELKV